MANAIGCLRRLTAKLVRLGRNGDVEGFRAYVRGVDFLADFAGLDAGSRRSALRCYARAEALCEAKARHPLVRPGPIDAKRARKANWGDPVMRTKLASAYDRAGGDHEQVARMMGLSPGSCRLAKKRHLDATTARHGQKAS